MEHCYVGYSRCGCPTMVIVDLPGMTKEVVKETGAVIKRGGTVQRMTVARWRKRVQPKFGHQLPCAKALSGEAVE